jgi:hypothetical protein
MAAAASERNFSTFGFVHSKLRNCLGPEKVKKLVYIKTNAMQMSDTKDGHPECYAAIDSDEEEEVRMERMELDQGQD